LLFTDDQRPQPAVIPLSQLAAGPAYFPPVTLEDHQAPDDKVTVIDVSRDLLEKLVPTTAELPYLAHLRRTGDGPHAADAAVVIGSRLPPAGAPCTAHLVSVEGRYGPGGFDLGTAELVRLVSLASWRFACIAESQGFAQLVRDLASDAVTPYRLPDSGDADADRYLRQGYVPMPHLLRQGGTTVSWYRGPLVDGPVTGPGRGGTLTADHLLVFQPETGMFSAGYAAAWQLGLLALRSTSFATALADWKRRRAQSSLRASLGTAAGFPLAVPLIDDAMPTTVMSWLGDLAFLAGVPPMYLIPDERLLPVETVRFVQIDASWILHLLDGAFSIGRLSAVDAKLDAGYPLEKIAVPVTGALIRSDVVSGYPGLVVNGYADAVGGDPLQARRLLLAPSVMLCLFGGPLARLEISQQPESLHFAVELQAGTRQFTKRLRNADGQPDQTLAGMQVGQQAGAEGRLPITRLAEEIASALRVSAIGPGDFARQMIETAESVRFLPATTGLLKQS
jgi:hypothetical protein